ncbi:MAG: AzlC family ABC transporter permease [Actinomycetia bacterium]|nr:AzlC family ABC transporter permease [Actinomycetes bacterium]
MWYEGARSVAPILLGVVPFGLIFGVTAAASDVPILAAWASSFIIFAGAAQLAVIGILGAGGAAIVAVFTAVVINARHLMYSADMGRYTAGEPLVRKAAIAYVLTDQAYLVTSHRFPDPSSTEGFTSFYFGSAVTLWLTWQVATTAGILLGTAIPSSWSLEFAIPLTFLALLILAIKDKPGLVAAAVGGGIALATVGLPFNLGLLIGALAGIAAGVAAERAAT